MIRHHALILSLFLSVSFICAATANAAGDNADKKDSPSFERVMQEAYKHRPEIRVCIDNLNASAEEIRQAASGFLPQADINWQRGVREQDRGDQIFENREFNIAIPVFRGGRTVYGYKGAKLVYDERLERCKETEQNILNDAAQSYIDLAFRHSILGYFEQNVTALTRNAERAKRLARYGQAADSDVLLAQAEASYAKAERADARRGVDVARKKLFHFSGIDITTADFPDIGNAVITDANEAENALLEQHPSLRAARAFAAAADYAAKAEKGGFLPSADLSYNKSKQESPLFVQGDLEFSTYTFNVNVPLFAGGGNLAAYRRQQFLKRAAIHDVAALEIALKNELAEQMQSFKGAGRSLIARLKGVNAAEAALKGIRREYREGLRPLTEALQSEKDVLQQRRNAADERRRRLSAYYNMMMLTGSMTPERFGITPDYPEYEGLFSGFSINNDKG